MKYYNGPDGVFYDAKNNDLFILEANGIRIFNRVSRTYVGRKYAIWWSSKSYKDIALEQLDNWDDEIIRLGEL